MIYIDPPYNTGGDGFVYADDRKYTPKELSRLCGMSEQECKKMLEYYSKGKNSHSAWLTFMYPRLALARNLLKDDGVIFISIDDNEQAQLKLLCDEIFGEENFVATVIWEKKYSPQNDAKWLSDNHDFILIYARNKNIWRPLLLPRTEKMNNRYKNIDNDPRGAWKSSDCLVKTYMQVYDYPITTPSGRVVNPPKGRCWMTSSENFKKLVDDNRIWFGENGDNVPSLKRFLSEVKQGLTPLTIWKYTEVGHNQEAMREITNFFGGEKIFETPKPTSLIKHILKISTLDSDDIILDFFAGSGTTAQAVMELNAEDGGNRKFILVQLPEPISEKSKSAYDFVKNTLGKEEPKISDITQERIIRASKQIQEKYPEYQGDLGFQVLELEEIPSELAEIRQSDFEKINHLFAQEDLSKVLDTEAILQTFCLYDSIPLGAKLEEVDLGRYIAYKFEERIYLLHQGFQTHHLKELLRKIDEERGFCINQVVLLTYCFESARRREIAEALNYLNRKSLGLKLLVRG